MRGIYKKVIKNAFDAGIADAWAFWDMCPAEISGRLEAHRAKQKQAFEAQDFTAWLIGAYVGTAVNNPKQYPKKPDKVTIKEPPKPTTEMTSDTLKDVLTVFAEMHNATEGAKRHDLRRTSN